MAEKGTFQALKRVLCFLRLVDPHDGLISLTNVMMMTVLLKLIATRSTSLMDLGMFLGAVLNYTGKRYINQGLGQPDPAPVPTPIPPGAIPLRVVQ
jgi:hypothetical protein